MTTTTSTCHPSCATELSSEAGAERPGNATGRAGILGTVTVRIRRVTTTRAGGVSAAPFDSFNMGDHVGDDPEAVAANRQRLAAAIGLAGPHRVDASGARRSGRGGGRARTHRRQCRRIGDHQTSIGFGGGNRRLCSGINGGRTCRGGGRSTRRPRWRAERCRGACGRGDGAGGCARRRHLGTARAGRQWPQLRGARRHGCRRGGGACPAAGPEPPVVPPGSTSEPESQGS